MGLLFSNIPELEGTNTEIALANLSVLEHDLGEMFEKRIAHLCELALSVIKDGGDIDLIKSIIVSIRPDDEINLTSVISDNISYLNSIFSEVSLIERIIIFRQVFDKIPEKRISLFGDIDKYDFDTIGRIAYIQNSYNDLVYDCFSALLTDAKASYYDSVTDVCENILNGKCQFCILPIETSKDGKLTSFYDIILKHGLKINAEYNLYDKNGSSFTRYALLATNLLTLNQKTSKKYIQIAYSDTENVSLKQFISAAEMFNLKLENADTLLINEGSEKKVFCLEFSSSDADIQTFITYLSVDCPDHIFIGLYQKI